MHDQSPADSHADLMLHLKERHGFLKDLIGPRPFHYVDIPIHGNIGDLLIMHGTLVFFRNHGIWPKIIASDFEFSPAWVKEDEVIVFHGGGNFGDLYAGTHRARERVIAARPDNRIVVLPQTIHFSSAREQQRSAALFRRHRDVHICVRDETSYRIALEFSDHVHLVPDMAHQLFPVTPDKGESGKGGALLISRVDDEKRSAAATTRVAVQCTTDWPEIVGERERTIEYFRKTARWLRRMRTARMCANTLSRYWVGYSHTLVDDAIALFSSHDHVITDRLHGHILACLMSKPNTVLDNNYGKNRAYLSAWTSGSKLVHFMHA